MYDFFLLKWSKAEVFQNFKSKLVRWTVYVHYVPVSGDFKCSITIFILHVMSIKPSVQNVRHILWQCESHCLVTRRGTLVT